MIPVANNTVEVQSSLTGESGEFSIDEDALAHIMSVLSNLYSDPEGAVTREYLTNAYDAQVEAGMVPGTDSWKPITVTTPSHWNKTYSIRDYGVGMSVDDVKNIFSKYGKSTKRGSNDVVGMLGLGSKSALTYTNTFTITGYKNGIRTKAIISKNEVDIPEFHIVDTRATDEPNGVEISIPVKDRNSFAVKTAEFLKFWEPGLVLVDGAAPRHHGLQQAKPGVFLNAAGWGSTSHLVMGNVPYQIDNDFVPLELREANVGFVAYVPIGTVSFAPSREKLYYNDETKKVIANITSDMLKHVISAKQAEVAAAKTHYEAWKIYNEVPHNLTRLMKALHYKGEPLNRTYFDYSGWSLEWDYNGRGVASERRSFYLQNLTRTSLVVTGLDKAPTTVFKKKVRHYCNDKGLNEFVILTNIDTDPVWLEHLPRVSADDIRAIKLPRDGAASGPRTIPGYDVLKWNSANDDIVTEEQDKVKGKTVLYISPADMRETRSKSGVTPYHFAKTCLPKGAVLVVLGTNRFARFKREHPNARHARGYFTDYLAAEIKSISDAEYMVDTLTYASRRFLAVAPVDEIRDPDLRRLAKTVQNTNSGKRAAVSRIVDTLRLANIRVNIPERNVNATSVTKMYPMLDACAANMSHGMLYVNAAYNHFKKGK